MNTIFQISERVQTNEPLPSKYKIFEKIFFNRKTKIKKISENFIFSRFLMLPQQTTESAACTMCPTPNSIPTVAKMVYPNNFLQKWVGSIVLQKSEVEISEVRSAILKKCAVYIFRSARQYLRSAHWYFNLEGLSN